jgi:excisionase family DNA binding protein
MVSEILTVDEAAAKLRMSRRSFYRLAEAGRIRIIHPTPGRARVTQRELDAYVASLERRRVA